LFFLFAVLRFLRQENDGSATIAFMEDITNELDSSDCTTDKPDELPSGFVMQKRSDDLLMSTKAKNELRGFSGLASLVSDIDDIVTMVDDIVAMDVAKSSVQAPSGEPVENVDMSASAASPGTRKSKFFGIR
jgi:hypothetical protein